jgi:hypothetical protein
MHREELSTRDKRIKELEAQQEKLFTFTLDVATKAGIKLDSTAGADVKTRALILAMRKFWKEEVTTSETRNTTMREALSKIRKLGRVCPEFETCTHPVCADSAAAVLIASEALGYLPVEER